MIFTVTPQGPQAFGAAYAWMLDHDVHAPGSVDRLLWTTMTLITDDSLSGLYRPPQPVRYRPGSRPRLEAYVADVADTSQVETFLDSMVQRLAAVAATDVPAEELCLGGTEEEILERVTDWCVDLARAACALCQVAGLPSRLVFLANTKAAYSGHQVIEVFRAGAWGAADPTTGVVYRRGDGRPASVAELQREPDLVRAHASPERVYTRSEQFRSAAVFDYDIADAAGYDYTTSVVNAYYRDILEHADGGWEGGLRWLHGEDDGG